MVKEFVIDRSRWDRGTGAGSLLRDSLHRQQCCIGHYLTACGVPDDALLDNGQPEDVGDELPEGTTWLIRASHSGEGWSDTTATGKLIEANDDGKLEDEERERRVARVFEQHGIRVTFVDASPSEGDSDG